MSVLEKLMKVATRAARHEFGNEGSCGMPKWLIEDEHGHRILIATPFEKTPDYKDIVANSMRQMLKEFGAVAYVLAVESWFISHKLDDPRRDLPPSQCADRQEGVFICGEDIHGNSQSILMEIKRDGDNATLGKAQVTESSIGRFVDMFSVGPYL